MIIIITLIGIIAIQNITLEVDAQNNNCSSIPAYHMFHIKRIAECLQNNDNTQIAMIDATNRLIDSRLSVVENRLNVIKPATIEIIENDTPRNQTGEVK